MKIFFNPNDVFYITPYFQKRFFMVYFYGKLAQFKHAALRLMAAPKNRNL